MKRLALIGLALLALSPAAALAGRVPAGLAHPTAETDRKIAGPAADTAPVELAAPVAATCLASPVRVVQVTLCVDRTVVPPGEAVAVTASATAAAGGLVPDGTPLVVWGSTKYGPYRYMARCVTVAGACEFTVKLALAINFYAQHNVPGGVQTPGHGITVNFT